MIRLVENIDQVFKTVANYETVLCAKQMLQCILYWKGSLLIKEGYTTYYEYNNSTFSIFLNIFIVHDKIKLNDELISNTCCKRFNDVIKAKCIHSSYVDIYTWPYMASCTYMMSNVSQYFIL